MNICFFGDSILWGANDYESGGYVERLKSYFLKEKVEIDIYNMGVSGESTGSLLLHLENDLISRNPEVIFFAIGINDTYSVNGINDISLDEFNKNILEIYNISKKFTDKIVFIEITKVDEEKTNPIPWMQEISYENKSIKRYNKVIRDFCSKNNLTFLELNDIIELSDLDDGIHPNSKGHKKIFNIVLDFLKN